MSLPIDIINVIFLFRNNSAAEWLETVTKYGKQISEEFMKLPILGHHEKWWMAPEHLRFDNIDVNYIVVLDDKLFPRLSEQIIKAASTVLIDTSCPWDDHEKAGQFEVAMKRIIEYGDNIEYLSIGWYDVEFDIPDISRLTNLRRLRLYSSPEPYEIPETVAHNLVELYGDTDTTITQHFTSLKILGASFVTKIHKSVCARLEALTWKGAKRPKVTQSDYFTLGEELTSEVFPNLQSLCLTSDSIDKVPILPSLRELRIYSDSINDNYMIPHQLVNLELLEVELFNYAFERIPKTLTKLKTIKIEYCNKVYENDIPEVPPNVEHIKIVGYKGPCEFLHDFPKLKSFAVV
jgi:hypothetical protein